MVSHAEILPKWGSFRAALTLALSVSESVSQSVVNSDESVNATHLPIAVGGGRARIACLPCVVPPRAFDVRMSGVQRWTVGATIMQFNLPSNAHRTCWGIQEEEVEVTRPISHVVGTEKSTVMGALAGHFLFHLLVKCKVV